MDFQEFILALVKDWVSLMSGIASVILSILGTVRKWEQVPRWVWLSAAAGCFLFATARIWTTEHRAKIVAEQKWVAKENERPKPELGGEIEQFLWMEGKPSEGKPSNELYLLVRIKNIGPMPSVAEGFRLRVDTLGIYLAPTLFPKRLMLRNPNGRLIADFHPDNDLLLRAVNAIPIGTPIVGWVRFVLPLDKNLTDIRAAGCKLRFSDILDHEYVLPVPEASSNKLMYYPGSGSNPLKLDELPVPPKAEKP